MRHHLNPDMDEMDFKKFHFLAAMGVNPHLLPDPMQEIKDREEKKREEKNKEADRIFEEEKEQESREISSELSGENQNNGPRVIVKAQKRNAPCGCGSGKKYKKCCGSTALQQD